MKKSHDHFQGGGGEGTPAVSAAELVVRQALPSCAQSSGSTVPTVRLGVRRYQRALDHKDNDPSRRRRGRACPTLAERVESKASLIDFRPMVRSMRSSPFEPILGTSMTAEPS
jgi:hypothetical protein